MDGSTELLWRQRGDWISQESRSWRWVTDAGDSFLRVGHTAGSHEPMNLANGAGSAGAVHVCTLAATSAVSFEGPGEAHLTVSLLWDLHVMTSQE